MKIYETGNFKIEEESAVAIGNFDGIHLGHQELIKTVLDYRRKCGYKAVIFSFDPHPVDLFGKIENFRTILSVEEKKYVAARTGVDILIQYPFDYDFASLSPEEFVELLYSRTNCRVLVVGENYCFGKNRAGNIDTLRELGRQKGITVIGIPRVKVDGARVSSTRIRGLIKEGNMEYAAMLLNKPYFVMGKVVKGYERGRSMNFPTVNIEPDKKKLLPPDGVYFSTFLADKKEYYGMSNIGKNPTFDGDHRKIETHIFDFNKDIYGKEIIITFYKKIRGEIKFESKEKLISQLKRDMRECIFCENSLDVLKYEL